MSHFTVLVVTSKKPTEDVLEKALLPFHEHESTGRTEYCEWVDETDELRKQYEAAIKRDLRETASFEQYAKDDGCQPIPDKPGRYGRLTNPNKKWDWYQLGGRWCGSLFAKKSADSIRGQPGLMDSKESDDGVDACRKGDLDLVRIEDNERYNRAKAWDLAECEYLRRPVDGFPVFADALRAYKAKADELMAKWEAMPKAERPAFHKMFDDDPTANGLRNAFSLRADFLVNDGHFDREKYIHGPVRHVHSYAILKDGKWIERGRMGWFGMSSNEQDAATWGKTYDEVLASVPDDHWLAIVDCHI